MRKAKLVDLVVKAVSGLGECTPGQVLAVVGCFIEASRAAKAGRAYIRSHYVSKANSVIFYGRKAIVQNALLDLAKRGKIRRVRRGVYAPILTLYNVEEAS